ncbi:hypothetical protein TL16_g12977 [Triparma laevis f. inornata]|uniref:Ribosomal protein L1 n=2 Tax=Triparma laevis TaxID=1534972 RepID=A0A9W6ZHX0_9STRA|nr:hypothetical protein TrLO_g159 [Triparma laevis f. longispina]GMH94692.1 hypothetical protein TL16_g12977 [Triparma laevis f. inornata]
MTANTAKPHSISKDLVLRATRGLISHLSKASSTTNKSLLDEEGVTDYVMASFQLQKIPAQGSPKPIRIEVPHRVMTGESADDDTFEVCLIVKDESKAWVKALIESTPSISYVTKVLTLSKLRSDYSTFQQRRELLASYDFFLADDRILPMIGSKLGKNFFQAKKQPIAVKLTRKESLPLTISKALESTYLFISTGPCLTVKCGRAGVLSEKKLVENVLAVVENCVKKIPGKWGNIREIGIRCGQSATVPVYARTTAQLRDIEGLGKSSVSGVGVVETNLEVEEKIAKKKEVEKKKSKSPLLNALKKKKEEKQEEILEEEKSENRKAKRAKKQPEERPPVKEKKVTKKRKGSVEKEVEEEEEVEKVSPKKKTKKAAVEEKKAEKKAEKKVEKKVKAVVKEVSEDLDESFISKKKFTGRKPGFVFKKGKKGLGYYKDEIPKVDSAFLEQLQRQAGGGRRGGGGRKGGRKGRR